MARPVVREEGFVFMKPVNETFQKRNLNLVVDEKTSTALNLISVHRQKSVSALVEEWAEREIKTLHSELGIEAK